MGFSMIGTSSILRDGAADLGSGVNGTLLHTTTAVTPLLVPGGLRWLGRAGTDKLLAREASSKLDGAEIPVEGATERDGSGHRCGQTGRETAAAIVADMRRTSRTSQYVSVNPSRVFMWIKAPLPDALRTVAYPAVRATSRHCARRAVPIR